MTQKKVNKFFRTLRKGQKFHLIFWCGDFVEKHSFQRVLSEPSETLRKLCLSTKFPPQGIRRNYGILCSVTAKGNRKE